MDAIIIFVTCANEAEARKISEKLLHEKLVACTNMVSNISSHFWWQGKIDHAREILLMSKTKKSLFLRVSSVVKELHSYEVPEIIAVPIVEGSPEYLAWVHENIIQTAEI